MLGIMLSSFYIFSKSIQYTAAISRKILIVAWCLLWAVLFACASTGVFPLPLLLIRLLECLTSVVFAFFLARKRTETVISAYLLSFGISYFLFYIAALPISVISAFFMSTKHIVGTPLDYNQPVFLLSYSIVFVLQLLLSVLLFRIRRLRKGFPFIYNKFTIVVALVFTGVILSLVTWVSMNAASEHDIYYIHSLDIASVLIAGTGIYILIRRLIKMYQSKKAQQNSEKYYEGLYYELKYKYEQLLVLDKSKSSALHNFTDRLKSMEEAFTQGKASLEDIQRLQKDWHEELSAIKGRKLLPSTKVQAIDYLFEHFAKDFAADNITFNLMVDGSIKYMTENVIKQGKLEILIINHLKDAQIAVNASDNPLRRITAMIGLPGDCYEFTVFDSGIPFGVDTLARLGIGRVTTHADSGGSGIGFETTFEIMRECNASLIISEQEQSSVDYSKSVSVRFDGKSQYIIETYRPGEFPINDRYVIACR